MDIKIEEIDSDVIQPIHGSQILGAPRPFTSTPNTTAWSSSSPSGVGVSGGPYLLAANSTRLDAMAAEIADLKETLRKLTLAK